LRKSGNFRRSPLAASRSRQETQKTDVAKRRFRVRRPNADLGKASTIERRKLSQNFIERAAPSVKVDATVSV
jgi:hypothetical protein